MTRAALYLRQSLDVTEGIDRQRGRCEALVAARGWTVAAEFRDNDTSASKTRGPDTAWGQMLAEASAGRFDVVVAVDLDRLLRQTRDLVTLIDSGLKMVTVDGEIDLSTADGEFRATMLAGIARFEVRRKSERQRRANADRAERGVPVRGPRRFGFEADGITPQPAEAEAIRWAHSALLQGSSVYSIARRFNEVGPAPMRAEKWSSAAVRKLLSRPRNAGGLVHQGVTRWDVGSSIVPIVSREDHESVMSILRNPERGDNARRGPRVALNVLVNIATCGVCGSTMIAHHGMYKCGRAADGTTPDGARHVTIATHIADERVGEMMWAEFLVRAREEPEQRSPVAELHAELRALDERRTVVQELYALPGVDRAQVADQIRRLGMERSAIQERLDREAATNASALLLDAVTQVLIPESTLKEKRADVMLRASRDRFRELWADLDIERKRTVIRATVRVEVLPQGQILDDGRIATKGSRVRVTRK